MDRSKMLCEFHTGVLFIEAGGVRKQLPDIEGQYVMFRGCHRNKAIVFIGDHRVQVANGVDSVSVGWPLHADHEVSEWIPIANLNQIWMVGDHVGDRIFYMVVK